MSAQRPETHSLAVGAIAKAPPLDRRDVLRRAADFAAHPDDAHAGDLLSVSLIARQPEAAEDAARWILESETASSLMRQLANRALHPALPSTQGVIAVPSDISGTNPDIAAKRIAALRRRLALAPDDPMSWAELARQHTLTGRFVKAKAAMRIAITRAPSDRYLLRATARLYQHIGDPERAHALLVRAPRTPSDPWLVAAEITLATLAKRDPRFLRAGRQLLERGGIPPIHMSELASTLATLELDAGHSAHARRLFRTALEDPNDNALAQAEWAARQINLDVDPQLLSGASSWEARALAAAAAEEPDPTIDEAWGWFYDQPFASGPPVFGSYQASKYGRFAEGARFAKAGVGANPKSFLLRNNLAYCLAKTGKTTDARRHLELIDEDGLSMAERATVEATRGLISFRAGDALNGTRRYQRAIDMLPTREGRVLALINFAIETIRVDPPVGETLARQSQEEAAKLSSPSDRAAWLKQLATPPVQQRRQLPGPR